MRFRRLSDQFGEFPACKAGEFGEEGVLSTEEARPMGVHGFDDNEMKGKRGGVADEKGSDKVNADFREDTLWRSPGSIYAQP